MFEVIQCGYEDLPKEVREEWAMPNNGCGAEYATYIVMKYQGVILNVMSDAMEPEDASFGRDLGWIQSALKDAYRFGLDDGKQR